MPVNFIEWRENDIKLRILEVERAGPQEGVLGYSTSRRGTLGRWRGTLAVAVLFAGLVFNNRVGGAHRKWLGLSQGSQSDAVEPGETLVGAGDIVGCQNSQGALATAKLIEKIPGTVFTLGDLVYDAANLREFQNCYGRSWGRFRERTRPAVGNHEYRGRSATAYFQYWSGQAGPPGKGYYSYELGAWHVVVLNTNCEALGRDGCAAGSPEEEWLRQDLSAHPKSCIVAYGHHARFSSGVFRSHAVHPELKRFWEDLYAAHADLVLAGHEHSYERFAPQDPEGRADPQRGIREIVAGTGGRSHYPLGPPTANSEVQNDDTYGVLKLTLSPQSYAWEFIPEEGRSFRDAGSGVCHNRASQEAQASGEPN